MKRDKEGRLIVDDYEKLDDYIIGRKKKIWLSKDGKKYLFKGGSTNYEIYAELISYELAKQCGFKCAFYDLAILDGITGIITPSFLKKGDIIISGEQYLNNTRSIAMQNNLKMTFKENSIENILNAIAIQEGNAEDIAEIILFRLLEMWCFDLAIMESDRNSTNWSLIRSFKGNISLAPIYDCSTMCMMNNDVENIVTNLSSTRDMNTFYNLIDSIKYSLKINNNCSENLYEDFTFICNAFPNEIEEILYRMNNIDVLKAIDNIETRINNETPDGKFEYPRYVSYWLNKAITARLETMNSIFKKTKQKGYTK